MVMAKSGTSFERATSRRRNITLPDLVVSKDRRIKTADRRPGPVIDRGIPKNAIQDPTQSECPADSGISSYAPPAQDQVK